MNSQVNEGSAFTQPPEATWRVRIALRALGCALVALSLVTVGSTTRFYAAIRPFSLLSTYLSDMGNTPVWPQVIFNAGNLVGAPLRLVFLLLLVDQLVHLGAGQRFARTTKAAGAVLFAASVGMFAFPFGLDRSLHMGSAFVAFLGTVGVFTLFAVEEWKLGLPRVLPLASLAVALTSLVFVTLLMLVSRVPGVARETPVPWEWLTFALMLAWTLSHSLVLGRTPRAR